MTKFKRYAAAVACASILMAFAGCAKEPTKDETFPSTEATEEDPFGDILGEETVIVLPEIDADGFDDEGGGYYEVPVTTPPEESGSGHAGGNDLPEIEDAWDDGAEETSPAKPKPTDSPVTEGDNDLPSISGGDGWDDDPTQELVTEPVTPDPTDYPAGEDGNDMSGTSEIEGWED